MSVFRFTLLSSLALAAASALSAQTGSDEGTASSIVKAPAPAWVEKAELLDVPDDAQGLVFSRRQATVTRLTSEGELNYTNQVFRILHPQALQLGNVTLTWNPAAGSPTVHAVKIRRGSRVIDVLETNDFEILRREEQLETAMLDGLLTGVLKVPDLRVGDDLEVEYTVPAHDPTTGSDSSGFLALSDTPYGGQFELQLQWDEDQEPRIQMTKDIASRAKRGDRILVLKFDNPEAVTAPRNAPPRFTWMRVLEYSDYSDWSDISRSFAPLYTDAAQLSANSQLREEAAIIAESHDNKLAQMQAALTLVQQQIRYVYVGLNGGNLSPASADETWQRRYGDCKGKTVTLLALLKELGIDAEPVLVSNAVSSDGYEKRLPNPGLFDHVLVRAKVGGQTYWLDGTLPPVFEARERPFLDYEHALALTPKGAKLERLPFAIFELPQSMAVSQIDARAGFDEPAAKTLTMVKRGTRGLSEYNSFSTVTATQLETAYKSNLTGTKHWDSVESVTYRFDKETQASILTIKGTGPVDWEGENDDERWFYLPSGGFVAPTRRQRGESFDKDIPFYNENVFSCDVTTIRLPDDTNLANWGFNSAIDTMLYGTIYYRMMELNEDRSLRIVRTKRTELREVDAKRTTRDNARVDDFDNSKGQLYYDTSETFKAKSRLKPVPASYEIDWTRTNTACLPEDIRP